VSAAGHPWRLRLLLWLYSNRNIAGSLLALLGPTLYLAGVVDQGWLLITAGLYLTGALLAPSPPQLVHQLADTLDTEQLLRALDGLIVASRKQLSADMLAHLESIRGSVCDVLPRLQGAVSEHAFTVRQTIARYLPDALASYAALPPAYRSAHRLKDGKTAQQLLAEQLRLLDEQLQQVVVSVAQGDATALLVHDQFLRERFGERDPL
jgi:hypothetical protein